MAVSRIVSRAGVGLFAALWSAGSLSGVAAFAMLWGLPITASATTVFTDNFNRADSTTIGNGWVETSDINHDSSIVSNQLSIPSISGNDANAYDTQATSGFAAPWNNVLTNNPGLVTWTLNMRSSENDLTGFDNNGEGIAFVLAATSSVLDLTADGYAVLWGQTTGIDPIRLVRFSSGLQTNGTAPVGVITNLLTGTGGTGTPGDPEANYMSIKVTYDPVTDTWALFARSDGGSAFADPATGSYTSFGSVVNTTHTSATMVAIGAYGQHKDNNTSYLFDNVTVDVVPEPATLGMLCLGLALLARRRRRLILSVGGVADRSRATGPLPAHGTATGEW